MVLAGSLLSSALDETVVTKVMGLGMELTVMVGATIMRALLSPATMCPLEQALTGDDLWRRRAGPERYACC